MVKIDGLTQHEAEEILATPSPKEVVEFYNSPYDLTDEKVDYYNENGYVIVTEVLSGFPLEYAKKVIESAVLVRKGHDERALKDKTPYHQSFLQCGFLCWDYKPVRELVFGKRFAGIAKNLMKVNGIRLWHDQALFKEGGGRMTDIHQDSSYWPVAQPELTTTLWLALNDVPVEKGSLFFYPGSHNMKKEYVDIFNNPHKPFFLNDIDPVSTPLNAGDATFHTGLTYHGANENKSKEMRKGMTVIYINDKNKFDSSDERNATHISCEGLKHGEVIDTKYTPKLI